MKSTLKTEMLKAGQPYIDEPVYVMPKPRPTMEKAVGAAFNVNDTRKPITISHNRVRLNWIKPQ